MKRYRIDYIDCDDFRFKSYETDAEKQDDAIEGLRIYYGTIGKKYLIINIIEEGNKKE